jgi:hypothetical protein
MRWPRWRFSLRGMMIAVALTPIVLYAGQWAGMQWATMTWVATTPPIYHAAPPVPADRETTTTTGEWTESVTTITTTTTTVEWTEQATIEFSPVAALLAMAATTALLAAVWVLVASSIRRIKRA